MKNTIKTKKGHQALRQTRRMVFIWLGAISLLTSCKKSEVETFDQPAPAPSVVMNDEYVPVYPNTDAILVSIKEVTLDESGGQLLELAVGGARAIFPTKTGTLTNAGTVQVQNTPLTCESGNRYTYKAGSLAPDGIPFPDAKVRWNIGGNANIPPMNLINTDGFPEVSPILDNPETVDRSQEFTLALTKHIQNADSVRYTIASTNGYIYANDWAVNHSFTFSSSRLQALAPGEGLIKITAFRTVTMQINEKMIQAINQTVVSKKVVIL